MDQSVNNSKINHLIYNSQEPLLITNKFKSKLLEWSLTDWARILKNEKLEYRCGKYSFTKEPQWERTTETKLGKFDDIFCKNDSGEWFYFDYKYMKDWFKDVKELHDLDVDMKEFGLDFVNIDEFTIWIGSLGAHTPCHVDTYGCNLVFQLYGKKQWIIFPPEQNLQPTRIPYEESSIYSRLNFFSPTLEHFKDVSNARVIILNPGDVLFVPHKWWHYVENLETAISINIWLPLPIDDLERVDESLVQYLVKQFTTNSSNDTNNIILNPNTRNQILSTSLQNALEVVQASKQIHLDKINAESKRDKDYSDNNGIVLKNYDFIKEIDVMSNDDFWDLLKKQRTRFGDCMESVTEEQNNDIGLINAVLHPQVISLIREKFL